MVRYAGLEPAAFWQADALPTELVPHWVCNITFKHAAFKHSNYKMNNGKKIINLPLFS